MTTIFEWTHATLKCLYYNYLCLKVYLCVRESLLDTSAHMLVSVCACKHMSVCLRVCV